ncbi:MAG: type II CRISPR-associated endonuclease Cas1 [Christensenellaceae bacterium]|jgi:CRISPR-associated endonuclease cas1, NMENI subtype|nr:MAG: type II CRISPR-associated endonuclease Cas1 [Clostridiales bacterium]
MGFRTVIIKNRAKLEFRLNSLIVRGDTEKKIYIGEINTLIIQSTAVSLTASLLNELTKNNVKVIFCDEKCNPTSELLPYYGAHNTSRRYKEQFLWDKEIKARIWRKIVQKKIEEQSSHLFDRGFIEQSEMLKEYALQVCDNDYTNREGHAAKVYFNCLLGIGNSRQGGGFVNGCLNYGYSVLLSAFNREITASGYLTQLGIWHDNEFNSFNLSCDLMEPFRVVVDRTALKIKEKDKEFKKKLANILNYKTYIGGKNTTFDLAIRQYARSVFQALGQNDEKLIVFPEKITEDEL